MEEKTVGNKTIMRKCDRCNAEIDAHASIGLCAACAGDPNATYDFAGNSKTEPIIAPPEKNDQPTIDSTIQFSPGKTHTESTRDNAVTAGNIQATADFPVGHITAANASPPQITMAGSPDATMDIPSPPRGGKSGTVPNTITPAANRIEHTVDMAWGPSAVTRENINTSIKGPESTPSSQTLVDLNIRSHRVRNRQEKVQSAAEFEMLEMLGQGGMGLVYAARQTSIDRTIALKVLRSEYAKNPEHRTKFLAEAVVTGELDHPNIVPIYDVGSTEQGALFYAMKRVRGTPWSKVLTEKSLTENLAILLSTADAIAFAHSRGIVHRDLKPENIMLGDFGEVLVMDWGLALSQPDCVKPNLTAQIATLGGTPSYMPPEMATGPLEAIGPASDIYLLGAILFEIITGRQPHHGTSIITCLHAAARNEIVPTDKQGELMDIARMAMASNPQNRYANVRAFQDAIRRYQSHSESVLLATQAEADLARANQSREYNDFARALFAFQEAYALWSENHSAQAGEDRTRLAYAACALEKGDLDLGVSLLDPDHPDQRELYRQLVDAQRERDAKQTRLRNARRLAITLATLVFLIVSISLFWISRQHAELNSAFVTIQDRNEKLDVARKLADHEAEEARKSAEEARKAQAAEAYASYLAQIGLAAERIENNSFQDADRLLERYAGANGKNFRGWEWGYLRRLCRLDQGTKVLQGRGEALAIAANGKHAATITSRGNLQVWNIEPVKNEWSMLANWQVPTATGALAISADGSRVIVGTERGQVICYQRLADQAEYKLERESELHRSAITNLTLSPQGDLIASSSLDETAGVWSFPELKEKQRLRGHFGAVFAATFTPDQSQLATCGDDGTVRVWQLNSESAPTIYRGHHQPVYAVAVSPDGKWFASAGRDREIHLWQPQDLREFDFAKLERNLELARAGREQPPDDAKHHEPKHRLRGHSGEIRTLVFAANGKAILSGGHDNTLRYWRYHFPSDSLDYVTVLRGHGGWVQSAGMLPGGDEAASVGHDERLKLWKVSEYNEVEYLRGHEDAVLSSAFSRQGDRIVTASRDRRVLLWDTLRGSQLKELVDDSQAGDKKPGPVADLREGHEFLLSAAAFFPAGQNRLATAAGDNSVRIWDVATGAQVRRLDGTGTVSLTAVSPSGDWLLTGSDSNDAILWNMRETKASPLKLVGHQHEISAAAFAAGRDDLLATGDIQGRCILWQRDASASEWKIAHRLEGHLKGYSISGLRFSPNSSRVYVASQDQSVMQWNTTTGLLLSEETWKHAEGVKSFDLTTDGKTAVTLCATSEGGYRAFAWNTADRSHRVCELPMEGVATGIAFDNTGKQAYIATNSGEASTIWRWDLQASRAERLWPNIMLRGTIWAVIPAPNPKQLLVIGGNNARLLDIETGKLVIPYRPHNAVTSAHFSPNGQTIVSTGADGDVKIWDATENSKEFGHVLIKIPRAHERDGRALAVNFANFTSAGNAIATVGDDHCVKLWDLTSSTAMLRDTYQGHEQRVLSVQVAPDDKTLLTASSDGTARLWPISKTDAKQTATQVVVMKHPAAVLFAAYSPDGKSIVTGCADHFARVWSVEHPEQPQFVLSGHTAGVTAADVSPNGERLATGSQDGIVKIWDLATGKEVLSLKRHTAEITSAHFSSDGRNLLTGSYDQTGIIWRAVE